MNTGPRTSTQGDTPRAAWMTDGKAEQQHPAAGPGDTAAGEPPLQVAPVEPARSLVIAAFAALYLVWGSTYLAMRVAVETMPPLLMAGARFTIAGVLLYAFMRLRGAARPEPLHWRNAAVSGVFLLLGGNGLIVVAEQLMHSGLAALLVAIVPLWFALLEWLRGNPPTVKNVIGVAVGLAGVGLLVSGNGAETEPGVAQWPGIVMVLAAGILWAWGSLFMKHNARPASPRLGVAMQMITGGVALLTAGGLAGELPDVRWAHFSSRSWVAFAWLIGAGAWIGFSAYIWLLQVSTPARVATYAYVNPVIAVFLGWLLLSEPVTAQTFVAAVVIIAGVAIITVPREMVRRWLGNGEKR
jgi:drug/metabolite transporter (DMT)-like permease